MVKKLSILIFPVFILAFALATTAMIKPVDSQTAAAPVPKDELPVVGSYENLKKLLEEAGLKDLAKEKRFLKMTQADRVSAGSNESVKSASVADSGNSYSTTNIQVEGVDEADIIKTDGKYIYQVTNRQVSIVEAYPVETMKIAGTIKFDDLNFQPSEIYTDEKHLVVIGSTYFDPSRHYKKAPVPKNSPFADNKVKPAFIHSAVKAVVFSISNRENPQKLREIEVEGDYISSRKIGSALYIVANKHLDYYRILNEDVAPPTPSYRDSAAGASYRQVGYNDISYFPGIAEPNYLLIAGIDLNKPAEAVHVSTYLGSGQNIYASQGNLYVAVRHYDRHGDLPLRTGSDILVASDAPDANGKTVIYRFSLNRGNTYYTGKGEVPGTILNQFSMDEYDGHFRIATTKAGMWQNNQSLPGNNIYVLNKDLKTVGKIENIAPGERIYSTRFMGSRAYMVTFKQTDPLFVMDLKDPRNPKILGALKIPGYSDYLHPYDENHIIGFGKDTVEMAQKDRIGREIGTVAYQLGMKIALFDVSDVAHPVEKFKEIIGDRGTDSDLLYNHKALLFSREKNLMAFPVRVMEDGKKKPDFPGMPPNGELTFQGAYIYGIDLEHGFNLRSKITHHQKTDWARQGYGWFTDPARDIKRVLYIGEFLYTLSDSTIKAHDLKTLQEIKTLNLMP